MALELLIIPQKWAERYAPLPSNWWSENSSAGLRSRIPGIEQMVDGVAKDVDIDPRLLICRMQLEQAAITYKWDNSSNEYGNDRDDLKEKWLCGADKPKDRKSVV